MKKFLPHFFLILALASGFVFFSREKANNSQKTLRDFSNLELIDQENKNFSASNIKDSYWLVNFVFTSCPSSCPVLTKKMREIFDEYSYWVALKFITISVDPENDTPEHLFAYMKEHEIDGAKWKFLTGPWQKIHDLMRDGFLLTVPNDPAFHSEQFFLVGPNLEVLDSYRVFDKSEVIRLRAAISKLVSEKVTS